MRRRDLLLGTPAALLLPGMAAADEKSGPALSLAIAIGKRAGKQRQLEYHDEQSRFSVVLRNESREPQRVWREWCSWGYFALSFIAVTEDGKRHAVNKAQRDWGKNFPDFEELGPGEPIVREVFYGTAAWEGFPRDVKPAGRTIQLQAIYTIAPDEDSAKAKVWTGKVESPVIEVQLFGL